MVAFDLTFSPCSMDPGFPESNQSSAAITKPTPEPVLPQPLDVADWKATFQGGPPIDCFTALVFNFEGKNAIFTVFASEPDRIQYTQNPASPIHSVEGCLLESFDILLDAG